MVFVPLALSDPPRALRLAVWGVSGAVAGGGIAYFIGAHAFDEIGRSILGMLGASEARIASSEEMFARYGWFLVFVSTISPLSTKLTCIAAGAFGLPLPQFIPALIIGRATRFALLTLLIRYAGERMSARFVRGASVR
jgi:membrane protein YqaA with SNARE-associated domain